MIDLQGALNTVLKGIDNGLNEYSELVVPLITESTPMNTGALRQSERVDKIENGRRFTANTSYAMEQHEMPYPHMIGRSHYILAPLQETLEEAQKIIAKNVEDSLNGGGR